MDTGKVKDCLEKAEENSRKAAEANDPQAKESFEGIAGKWRAMAKTHRDIEALNGRDA